MGRALLLLDAMTADAAADVDANDEEPPPDAEEEKVVVAVAAAGVDIRTDSSPNVIMLSSSSTTDKGNTSCNTIKSLANCCAVGGSCSLPPLPPLTTPSLAISVNDTKLDISCIMT